MQGVVACEAGCEVSLLSQTGQLSGPLRLYLNAANGGDA